MTNIADYFDIVNPAKKSANVFFNRYIGNGLLKTCGIVKTGKTKIESYSYVQNELSDLCPKEENTVYSTVYPDGNVPPREILTDEMTLGFIPVSTNQLFKNDKFIAPYKKDVLYRFDGLKGANWERFHLLTARNVINDVVSRFESKVNVLIFDDSLYRRFAGKATELCGEVYDHNDHKLRLGYRMMTGGWSNGSIYVPFQQALLTTRKDELKIGPFKKQDMRTLSGKRAKRAQMKGTEVMFEMVKQAQAAGIPFDYVLFDTWFCNPAQVAALKGIGADTIAMVKKTSAKFRYTNEDGTTALLNIKEIFGRAKKRRGNSRYLFETIVNLNNKEGKEIAVKLVFLRNRNNRKDWICLLSSDLSLTPDEIMGYYTIRWKTEVYFKVCKSCLKLLTESRARSYDALTEHMVIVALRYMMLTMEQASSQDNRSIQDIMFGHLMGFVDTYALFSSLEMVELLMGIVKETFHASDEQMNKLALKFLKGLPKKWKPWLKKTVIPTLSKKVSRKSCKG